MKWSYVGWYLLVGGLALAPAGVRVLTWHRAHPPVVDTAMAQEGEVLFNHHWKPGDPLANGGDGLGPVFNADSCVGCHNQGGVGGAGNASHNVTAFTVFNSQDGRVIREGVVHADGVKNFRENLAQVHSSLPAISPPSMVGSGVRTAGGSKASLDSRMQDAASRFGPPVQIPHVSNVENAFEKVQLVQRNTPALFGANLIDALPDRVLIARERAERLKWGGHNKETAPVGRVIRHDGRVGKFGWKAQSSSLSDFVQAACANELGLSNPGQAQPRPLGRPDYEPPGLDLTLEQCNQLTAFVASLSPPVERIPDQVQPRAQAEAGKKLFSSIGCADCHTPDIGSIEGIYSDLLLHHMGTELQAQGGSYNEPMPRQPRLPETISPESASATEWRTPPLWGVADSAPYLHDGRAPSLHEAILMHGGQAANSSDLYRRIGDGKQAQLMAFLQTLRAR